MLSNMPVRLVITHQSSRNKPFWCSELKRLRKSARKLKNKARKSNLQADWDGFLIAQKLYKKSLRCAQRTSWNNFCEDIHSLPALARLNRALAKNDNCKLSSLRTPSGEFTSSPKEVGELLLSVHFPGCHIIDNDLNTYESTFVSLDSPNWDLAARLITRDVLHWSIFSFAPFKSGEPDGIFPAELQHFPFIKDHLFYLFQACIAFCIVPQSWSRSRVVFIPKAGKTHYADPKAFRPISLSSTLLKAIKRIVDRYIRDQHLSAQ